MLKTSYIKWILNFNHPKILLSMIALITLYAKIMFFVYNLYQTNSLVQRFISTLNRTTQFKYNLMNFINGTLIYVNIGYTYT